MHGRSCVQRSGWLVPHYFYYYMDVLLSLHFNKYPLNRIELNYLLSPLCRVFTIMVYIWNKSCFGGIQQCSYFAFTAYSTWNVDSHVQSFVLLLKTFRGIGAVPLWLFYVVICFGTFPLCCSVMFWMFLRWFHLSLLFTVLCLLLHSTRVDLLLQGLYTYFSTLSAAFWIKFLPLKLHLETNMFLFRYHGLWCPVYC